MRRLALAISLALLFLSAFAASHRRSHRGSTHAEIAAVATVETEPQRKSHKNRREFEEFDVLIVSAERVREGKAGSDSSLPIDTIHRVHVVHDLTCGGSWIDAKRGDRLEIRGEYVHPPRGEDLIHFTHPSNGKCESVSAHLEGYIRLSIPHPAPAFAEASSAAKAMEDASAGRPLPDPSSEARQSEGGGEGVLAAPPAPGDLFATAVRPVLARRCTPCHEKGGKMYARLPFDDPSVLSSHADGVRRRLKGEDLAAFERWLATVSQPSAPGS